VGIFVGASAFVGDSVVPLFSVVVGAIEFDSAVGDIVGVCVSFSVGRTVDAGVGPGVGCSGVSLLPLILGAMEG